MTDINEIFSRDPLSLTREDITEAVRELRERRGQFNLGNQKAGKVKSEKTQKAESLADKANVNLGDLGL